LGHINIFLTFETQSKTLLLIPSNSNINKQAIVDAYLDYFNAYSKRDWSRMVNRFAKEFTMFGTGIDEVSSKTEHTLNFFKREFEQSPQPVEYSIREIEVFQINSFTAYLIVLMDMKISAGRSKIDCPNNRSTVIMILEENEWKIAHGHWSQPAEGQDVGVSIPYKLLQERNKQLEERVVERTREIEKQNIELKDLNDTKTRLLSIIAHDLRSPFNAFMGLTEVMLLNFDENIKNKDYFKTRLEQINERAQHLYSFADNLLNWAWTQTEKIKVNLERVNVNNLLEKQILSLNDIIERKDITINFDLSNSIWAQTDSEVLGIILRNFISNAIKYSHRGSTVSISSQFVNGKVLISIIDDGVGMNPEIVNKILTSNNLESSPGTEKEKGTGLGLQICKNLLDKVRGTLCIDSEPEVGTKISITLPIN
jgi:signal transduction histidine kinase